MIKMTRRKTVKAERKAKVFEQDQPEHIYPCPKCGTEMNVVAVGVFRDLKCPKCGTGLSK